MAKTRPHDVIRYPDSGEMIEAYLAEAFENGDASGVVAAIGSVAKARSIGTLAEWTNLPRESLCGSRPAGRD